jgi:hypothetical protein
MPESPLTRGELWRWLEAFERQQVERDTRLEHRLDKLVSKDKFDALESRVDDLEERGKQHGRMFVGAFLYPVLVAIIVALVLTGR